MDRQIVYCFCCLKVAQPQSPQGPVDACIVRRRTSMIRNSNTDFLIKEKTG